MKTSEIFALCMIITVVSLMGFVVENVWLAITKGFIDNRNMFLPFLIGYGLAIAAIYLLFGTPLCPRILKKKMLIKNNFLKVLVYFLIVILCISIGEIVLGTLVEKTCGIIWWDYTRLPLHITRYTSIPTSIGFALLITIFMRYFFMPLMNYFEGMNSDELHLKAVSSMIILSGDFIINSIRAYRKRRLIPTWQIIINPQKYERIIGR